MQEIYARLLAKGYQSQVFSGLEIHHTEKVGRETLSRCLYCQDEKHFIDMDIATGVRNGIVR
jgi:hypothetical protein